MCSGDSAAVDRVGHQSGASFGTLSAVSQPTASQESHHDGRMGTVLAVPKLHRIKLIQYGRRWSMYVTPASFMLSIIIA